MPRARPPRPAKVAKVEGLKESPSFHPAPQPPPADDDQGRACPLCGAVVRESILEEHLRLELNYAAWRCGLCSMRFVHRHHGEAHFRGRFARHPRAELALFEVPWSELDERLASALDSATKAELPPDGDANAAAVAAAFPVHQALADARQASAHIPSQGSFLSPGVFAHQMGPQGAYANQTLGQISLPQASFVGEEQLMPTEAASEEEEQQMEFKPKLEEGVEFPDDSMGPVSRGKVLCSVCQAEVGKSKFDDHVVLKHLDILPFFCGLCNFKARRKDYVKKHLKTGHGVEITDTNHSSIMAKLGPKIDRLKRQCFGALEDIPDTTYLCKVCEEDVPTSRVKDHVATQHLRKPVYECTQPKCKFTSTSWVVGPMRVHQKTVHLGTKAQDGLGFRCQQEGLGTLMASMIKELFGYNPKGKK